MNKVIRKIKSATYTVGGLTVLAAIHTYVWVKKKFRPNYTGFKF